jgi:outer membrane lipoprotein-sorting protein
MKSFWKNQRITKGGHIFTILVMTGILSSTSSDLLLLKSATATPINTLVAVKEVGKDNLKKDSLPPPVARAVLRDISRQQGILPSRLKIIEYNRKTWRNGCLELPRPDELCTQVLVPGWQVVVSDGNQKWIYHTNNNGRSLRWANTDPSWFDSSNNLPKSVRNAVLQAASRRSHKPVSRLKIIQAQRRTWRDGCLELGGPGISCIQVLVPGWRVVVSVDGEKLVYHTNESGSLIRFNEKESKVTAISDRVLPQGIKNAVLRDASEWSKLSISSLRIVKSDRHVWGNPCEVTFDRTCNKASYLPTPGWIVTVDSPNQQWIYHVSDDASVVALDQAPSLSEIAAKLIKQDAAKLSQTPVSASQLRIIKVQRLLDENTACQGTFNCTRPATFSWQATVSDGRKSWVYRVKDNGEATLLWTQAANFSSENITIPQFIADTILTRAAQKLGLPVSQLRIVQAQQKQWRDRCLGISEPLILCTPAVVPGWLVTVSDGQQHLVYRVGKPDIIKFDKRASKLASKNYLQTVPIPINELPPPLESGMVFREISSGGFTGRTYKTFLLDDGRLIRLRSGDANDSERSVRQISLKQLRQFQRLLQKAADEFRNLSYPAPAGAADYITHTLTSPDGSVQFNSISQDHLPKNLQLVFQAWNQLLQ